LRGKKETVVYLELNKHMNELDRYFVYKCEVGLQTRGLLNKVEYRDRLRYEMETIIKMGFPGYFLIVQDFIEWAKRNGIYVGPGRGSAAGSLVAYCLRITEIDPLKFGLLFERFLNPDRISMPDIDVDFEKRFRDRVIDYVTQKYGDDRVAHIGTFNMQRAKAAVRSIAKTLGHPYAVGDQLAKLLLAPVHGKPQTLTTSIKLVPELHAYRNSDSTQGDILRWAEKVEDHINSVGVHASGVVISNETMMDTVPLFKGRGDEVTTQWEMNNIEEFGLIKFDFLGLEALDKIHKCVDIIEERHRQKIDINQVDIEDDKVYANLRTGDNVGVFQLEASSGMKDLLVLIRPTCLEDLIALVAIYRPGPLDSDYKDIYLSVRAGQRDPEYLVPELEPILSRTAGWLIYQEQIMEIAKQLCGYTGGEADELRKAVGKKKRSLMEKHEPKFKQGWKESGLPEKMADRLWNDMVAFAAYGFNKSHAAAYAYITYQTAWLKTHYPVEYMCAVMTCDAGNKDQMIRYLAECKRLGIEVLPPDINESRQSFHVTKEGKIRFGLGPIKNLGEGPVEKVIEEREKRPFTSLRDFCERVDLGTINRLKLDSLIKAGAFDCMEMTRATMQSAVEIIWDHRAEMKKYFKKLETYQKKLDACAQRLEDIEKGVLSDKGKKLKPLKPPERPEEPEWPTILEMDELPQDQLLADEHELLGFFVSAHPLEEIGTKLFGHRFNSIEDIKQMPRGTKIQLAAVTTNKTEITTSKSKKKMAFLTFEDLTGSIEGVCFPNVYEANKDMMEESKPISVAGVVEVTEADDGRVTKIVVRKMGTLDLAAEDTPERIVAEVKATRASQLTSLLEEYKGDLHEVQVVLKTDAGATLRSPTIFKIGNYKGAFMRKLTRINNGENQ